jgi:uncharacterized cofD-like protein
MADGSVWIGQSNITSQLHPPIRRLAIVKQQDDGEHVEVRPPVNTLAAEAIRKSALVAYTMGSFYTSIVPNLLVTGVAQVIRETKRPKVFVANLIQDQETPEMTVSMMLEDLHRYLKLSDPGPATMEDYVQYVLVGTHGDRSDDGRIPVDAEAIRRLGVEPIILPLEEGESGRHNPDLVAAVLLSLC